MIELNCFFYTEQTGTLADCGIEIKLEDNELRPMTFLNINAISKHFEDDGTEYCAIHTNNTQYICELRYDEVKRLLM